MHPLSLPSSPSSFFCNLIFPSSFFCNLRFPSSCAYKNVSLHRVPSSPFLLMMSQQSGFSHGSRSSSRSRYVCRCNLDAPLMTAWTNANPGCRFYGCGMYTLCIRISINVYRFNVNGLVCWCLQLHIQWCLQVQGFKKCSHFIWLDEEMNPRAKELISALLKNINEKKVTVKSYKAKEEELKMKMKMLKKQLNINWMLLFVMLFTFVGTTLMKYLVG